MAASTIPALSIGGITLANNVLLGGEPISEQRTVIVGTVVVTLALGALDRVSPELAEGIAWVGIVTVLFVRTTPNIPSPVERLNDLIRKG